MGIISASANNYSLPPFLIINSSLSLLVYFGRKNRIWIAALLDLFYECILGIL